MIMINWPSKYLVLARCVVFIRFDYALIAEDSLWFLFWSQKKRVRERKEKKKKEAKNVRMIHFLSTSCWFKTTKNRRGSLRSGPKKERARERETREGRGRACPESTRKSFQLAFCECGYFQLVERLPRGKLPRWARKLSINSTWTT